MASGWNLWVWLQGVGLAGVVVRRYIDILIIIINFPHSTCIMSFFGSSILTSLFIFKWFFGLKNKKPKWRFLTSAARM